MSDTTKEFGGTGPSHQGVEIGVAAFMALLALVGIYGSLKVGIGWGSEGPKAGFFPFYVSLAVIIASAVNLAKIFATADDGELFASWGQLRLVLAVVIPTAIYVVVIPYLGIYVASAILIIAFMRWLGRYPWVYAVGVGALAGACAFLTTIPNILPPVL